MLTEKKIKTFLKKKYDIIVGEKTLAYTKRRIKNILRTKMQVQGRSCKTGRKKSVIFYVNDLL